MSLLNQPQAGFTLGIQPDADDGGMALPEASERQPFAVKALDEGFRAIARPFLVHGGPQRSKAFVLTVLRWTAEFREPGFRRSGQRRRPQIQGGVAN